MFKIFFSLLIVFSFDLFANPCGKIFVPSVSHSPNSASYRTSNGEVPYPPANPDSSFWDCGSGYHYT